MLALKLDVHGVSVPVKVMHHDLEQQAELITAQWTQALERHPDLGQASTVAPANVEAFAFQRAGEPLQVNFYVTYVARGFCPPSAREDERCVGVRGSGACLVGLRAAGEPGGVATPAMPGGSVRPVPRR